MCVFYMENNLIGSNKTKIKYSLQFLRMTMKLNTENKAQCKIFNKFSTNFSIHNFALLYSTTISYNN